jgi:hypothetical protein
LDLQKIPVRKPEIVGVDLRTVSAMEAMIPRAFFGNSKGYPVLPRVEIPKCLLDPEAIVD